MKERNKPISHDTQPIPTVTELRVVGTLELADEQISYDRDRQMWVFHTKDLSGGQSQVVRLEIPADKIKVFSSPDTSRLCYLSNTRHLLFLRRDHVIWNHL